MSTWKTLFYLKCLVTIALFRSYVKEYRTWEEFTSEATLECFLAESKVNAIHVQMILLEKEAICLIAQDNLEFSISKKICIIYCHNMYVKLSNVMWLAKILVWINIGHIQNNSPFWMWPILIQTTIFASHLTFDISNTKKNNN